jgi:hypothetical protein
LLGVEVDRGVDAGDEDEDEDEDVGDLWGRRGDLGGRGRRLDAVVLINIAAICSWSSKCRGRARSLEELEDEFRSASCQLGSGRGRRG